MGAEAGQRPQPQRKPGETKMDWYQSLSIIEQFNLVGPMVTSAFVLIAMVRDYLRARQQ
jgi:hypothetical protein